MADMFKSYQGGIAPIQGIREAGASIGEVTGAGLASFGKSLSEGIQAYHENTQKRQVVDQQSKALGAQLQRYHQMFSQTDENGNLVNPEYAGLAEGLQSQIEALSKVPSMSLGSALGAVNAAQAAFQGLDKELAVNEMMKKATLEKGIYAAEKNAPDKEKYDVPALMQSGKWGYNPNMSYAQNEVALRDFVKKAKEADPSIKGDVNEVVSKWRSQVQGLAAGIQDEQQKAMILDEIEAARRNDQRQKDVVSEYEKSGLAAGVMKFAGMYGEDLTKDMSLTTETTQALLDSKNKPAETATEENKVNLTQAQQQLQKQIEPALDSSAKVSRFGTDLRIKALERLRDELIADKAYGGNVGTFSHLTDFTNINKLAESMPESEGKNLYVNSNRFTGTAEVNGKKQPAFVGKKVTEKKGEIISNVQKDIDEILETDGVMPSFVQRIGRQWKFDPEQKAKAIAAIESKISTIQQESKKEEKTPEQIKQESQNIAFGSPKTEPAKPLGVLSGTENLQFGTKEVVRDIPVAQKRAQVADYFKTKFGYVPSGFNEVYAKIHPESVLQTTQVGGVNLLWDGQKWTQLQGEKQLTVDEQLKLRSRQFGALDKEGKPVKTEIIPNSGIYAYGTFNSASTKRVDDFRQFTAEYSQVDDALNKLEELNKKWGGSLSPSARKEADQYKARIRALLKMEVANTGSVSDFEQRRIDDVTPAVNELLSLTGANQRSIDVLREKLKANLTATGAAFGVDIEVRTGANSKEAVVRQAKLDRYRNQQ